MHTSGSDAPAPLGIAARLGPRAGGMRGATPRAPRQAPRLSTPIDGRPDAARGGDARDGRVGSAASRGRAGGLPAGGRRRRVGRAGGRGPVGGRAPREAGRGISAHDRAHARGGEARWRAADRRAGVPRDAAQPARQSLRRADQRALRHRGPRPRRRRGGRVRRLHAPDRADARELAGRAERVRSRAVRARAPRRPRPRPGTIRDENAEGWRELS